MTINHRFDRLQNNISSVATPSAQFAAKSQPSATLLRTSLSEILNLPLSDELPLVCLVVIDLLAFHGLRISEAIAIRKSDVLASGHCLVKGSKRSQNRIINLMFSRPFLTGSLYCLLPLENYYSRFYFYRQFKKFGIMQKFHDNSNYSVTHFFRHRLLEFLSSHDVSNLDLTHFIGHNSNKSILHYVSEKK